MTPTKLLIGQILVVLAIIVASIWTATQWAAAALAYQPELGPPWFILFDHPIYHPWSIFPWWFSFDAYAPMIFDKAGAIAAAGGFLGCSAAIFGSVWRARQTSNVTTYGSARWATPRDVAAANLFGDRGVAMGRIGDRYLRHDGPEHVMAFAPTRSGKGVGLVVPTLLSWTGSAVIHDIKGENWQLTAGWRARFSHCLLFNPTDARSAQYNPLLEVRRGIDEVRDVQNIADILVDPEGALERRNHWEKTSHSLLVGVILHVLYAEEEKTLARVATFLSDPQRSFAATLRRMMTAKRISDALGTATEQRAMRNYAGHRLAPWLAHVMVSRQETARALLTPGEVMQLAPTDEIVLISGHPPIRAKKLRYYEDRTFTARVLPAPTVNDAGYRDLPATRPDDWAGQVRSADTRLAAGAETDEGADAGGLEQARHPAHEIEPAITAEPEIVDPLGLGKDDGDQAAERRAMNRVQALSAARTVYGIDAASGQPDDLQLGF